MKLLLLMLFLPFSIHAQKLLLLDRSLIEPTTFANNISLEQLSKGSFPIYYNDVDPLLSVADQFLKDRNLNGLGKFASKEVKVGQTFFFTHMTSTGDYRIVLRTKCDNMVSSIVVANESTRKKAFQRLSIFIDYLKNNIAALE